MSIECLHPTDDPRGKWSLARIADDALARGLAPCLSRAGAVWLIPLEEARRFVLSCPERTLTWEAYLHWKAWEQEPPQVCASGAYQHGAA